MPQPVRVGPQIEVADVGTSDRAYYMQHPQIVGLPDGGFIAVWQQFNQTTSMFDATSIQGQIYNADGNARGGQFQINAPLYDYGDTNVRFPSVIVKSDGKVLVAWEQELYASSEWSDRSEIRMREIDPVAASPSQMFGSVVRAPTSRSNDGSSEYRPLLSATVNGNFVLEFSSPGGTGSGRYVVTPYNPVALNVGGGGGCRRPCWRRSGPGALGRQKLRPAFVTPGDRDPCISSSQFRRHD